MNLTVTSLIKRCLNTQSNSVNSSDCWFQSYSIGKHRHVKVTRQHRPYLVSVISICSTAFYLLLLKLKISNNTTLTHQHNRRQRPLFKTRKSLQNKGNSNVLLQSMILKLDPPCYTCLCSSHVWRSWLNQQSKGNAPCVRIVKSYTIKFVQEIERPLEPPTKGPSWTELLHQCTVIKCILSTYILVHTCTAMGKVSRPFSYVDIMASV